MPRIDPVNNRAQQKPKKNRNPAVNVPDRKDPTRSRPLRPVTPDQADRQRPAAQKARDRVVVARNVRESREKVVSKRGRGSGTRAVQKVILAPIRVQQGNQKVVSPAEARKLRAQGKTVRVQTRAERNDIGATQRSIGGSGGGLTRAPAALAIGLGQNPKKSLPATARGFRDALTGIPSSIASLISDPQGTLTQAVKDYPRRYGDLGKPGGVKKTADRITKEGAAPEILDIAILTTGTGAAVGRGLTAPAAAGKLGAKAKRVATEARPEKRVSGGKTVQQDKSKNLIVAARQSVTDKRKVTKNQKRVAAATAKGQTVDAVRQLAAQKGEIVAKPREARRIVAREKGRDLERMKREQREEVDHGTRRALNSLSKDERAGFAVAMKLGIPADPATARKVLAKRREQIASAREKEGVSVPKVLAKTNDELQIIDRLIADADKVFTPKLRQIVEGEQVRERRVAGKDPGLDPVQAQLSRYRAQAAYLGITRKKAEDSELAQARKEVRDLDPGDPRRMDAEAELEASRLELEDIRKASGSKTKTPDTPAARRQAKELDAAEERFWSAHEAYQKAQRSLGSLDEREASPEGASLAGELLRGRSKEIRDELDDLRAERDNSLKVLRALRGPDKPNRGGESPAEYLRRVKKAAAEAGLARPGYFHSQKRPRAGNADRAIGGSRAVADPKKYKGDLYRTGREDNSPIVQEQAIAKNIKRKWNWNLVAKNFDQHTFAWSKDKSVNQILDELDERGIDPNSVALWNPRRYYAARQQAEGDGTAEGRGEEPTIEGLDRAVDLSAGTVADLKTRPEAFLKTEGWAVIPKAIYDEIHADTRPSGAIGRGWDIAKGKQSRILLGLSPAWLQFQVASNALLSGLAGTGPVDLVKAHVWWKNLPDEQKAAIEPFIGTGAFQDSIQQTKLGAARTRSEKVNQMIDGYRAMKTTPFMQKVGRGNPLDMLFRADAAQNNAFRKGVLYSQVKRDAYKRMGQNTKAMAGLQTRFMHSLDTGPTKAMEEIIRDPRALERHAQHVNDFLGDYQTYTASERRGFQRAVMFYGFLRFSLRFTFMTMPIKHPIMSAIIAQLGRLQVDEVRKLLGGDELPWALGKFYFTKDGKLKSVDFSRANPAMNAITNFRGPKDALGFLPPIAGALLDQAYAKSGFKQREWRVEGENQARKGQEGYGVPNRVRIFLNQMFSLAAPYRAAMEATQPGPKGDDSLLGSPRPTEYKDPQTLYSIAASQENKPKTAGGRLAQQFLPFIPRNDDAPELAASIRARAGEDTGAAPRSVAPAPAATPSGPMTREEAQMELRRRMSRRSGGGVSAAQLELRRRMSQR